ncbi:hypothetical protein ACFZDK_24695 [Streptomyces sp. NPDC007901]|uniref:hypothetical protein n=1 Tax=Streptomyces sp. NPDC007901 TaxID=3364785 RepID=UPI0036E22457
MTATTLPVHPTTGRTALGWRKARPGEDPDEQYPIWPVLGAADDDDDDGQDDDAGGGDDTDDDQDDDAGNGNDDQDDDGADQDGADQLGDAGKQALDRMKERWRKERDRRKAAESERDQLKGTSGGNADDPERIRSEADKAATAKANQRIVRSEIRAAAAGKLANPRDALAFLDLSQFEVDDDGQIDETEIADAIEDLLKERPYLGATAAKAPEARFQGSGDGGARKGRGGPVQLTEQDVAKLTPEQIDEAHRKGQLRDYLGG